MRFTLHASRNCFNNGGYHEDDYLLFAFSHCLFYHICSACRHYPVLVIFFLLFEDFAAYLAPFVALRSLLFFV